MFKKLIVIFVACSLFVFSPIGIVEAGAAEPSLAQCQGEPSKGTGWGTFWMIYGGLNAVGGVATILAAGSIADDDDYYGDDGGIEESTVRNIGIASTIIGGGLMGLGIGMRNSANSYNETCNNLLSYKSVQPGLGVEPMAKGDATGMKMIYRW